MFIYYICVFGCVDCVILVLICFRAGGSMPTRRSPGSALYGANLRPPRTDLRPLPTSGHMYARVGCMCCFSGSLTSTSAVQSYERWKIPAICCHESL